MELEKPNLYQKIIAIMERARYIKKESYNDFEKFPFVSHDEVASVFHKEFVTEGLVVIPSITHTEFHPMGKRNLTIIHLTTRIVNADDPREYIEIKTIGHGADSSDKGPGKAYSYAYKYALLKLFCMPSGEKDESDFVTASVGNALLTKDQVILIQNQLKDHKDLEKRIINHYEVKTLNEIEKIHFDEIVNGIVIEINKKKNEHRSS